jgi:hypothetical protein
VPVAELNDLERRFLCMIEYNLFVTTDDFLDLYRQLRDPKLHTNCDGECTRAMQHYRGACTPPVPPLGCA